MEIPSVSYEKMIKVKHLWKLHVDFFSPEKVDESTYARWNIYPWTHWEYPKLEQIWYYLARLDIKATSPLLLLYITEDNEFAK